MLDATHISERPYLRQTITRNPKAKVDSLANLGTPDNYDYWSMRRYLGEFFGPSRYYCFLALAASLQLIILTSRPFRSGALINLSGTKTTAKVR